MSYANGTILTRDEPQESKFDRIRVIGPSPIRTASLSEWGGSVNGDLIIVEPLGQVRDPETDELVDSFSATELMPLERAYSDYSVESEPDLEPTHIETVQGARAVRQLTPEEQFRQAAKQAAQGEPKPRVSRKRTPIGEGEGA